MRIKDNVKHLNTSDIETRIHMGNRRHKRYVLSATKWFIDKMDSNSRVKLNVGLKADNLSLVSESSSVLKEAVKLWSDVTEIIFQFDQSTSLSIEYLITENLNDPEADYEIYTPIANTLEPSYSFNVSIYSWFLEKEDDIEMNRKIDNVFFNTIVHTLGHALGLNHSSATDSVMFPKIGGNFRKNFSNDDITAIQIEEEGEGWLIFMTVILSILMLAIIGTGSYLVYLIFIVPVLATPEERSSRPTQKIPLEQRHQTDGGIGGRAPHDSAQTLGDSSSTEHKAVPQKSPDVASIRSSDGSE